ncbi:hypothetical protein ABTF39_21560, partial [Acinetobacter baumannii]
CDGPAGTQTRTPIQNADPTPRRDRPLSVTRKVLLIPVTPFQQNCSLLIDERTGRAAVCDPGGDLDRIQGALKEQGV